MNKITLDATTAAQFQALTGAVAVCDASGRLLGHFTPSEDRSLYEGVEVPITEEELQRREQGTKSYTTAEVLAYLKNLEKQG